MSEATPAANLSSATRRARRWLTPERVLCYALAAIFLILGYDGVVNASLPPGRGTAVTPTFAPLEGLPARICGALSVLAGLWLIATAHATVTLPPTSDPAEHHEEAAPTEVRDGEPV